VYYRRGWWDIDIVNSVSVDDRRRGVADQFRVVLGDHNQAETEGSERQSSVVEVIVHDRYDAETNDYDVALLKLNSSQAFDCNVRPVCLPTDDVVVNTLCIVTGWGSTRGENLTYLPSFRHETELKLSSGAI